MEQAVLERRVRVIPATKPAPASGPRHSGRQRVAAYCRVSTDSEEQLNSYAAQQNYYTQKIEENPASPQFILTRRGAGYYFAVN